MGTEMSFLLPEGRESISTVKNNAGWCHVFMVIHGEEGQVRSSSLGTSHRAHIDLLKFLPRRDTLVCKAKRSEELCSHITGL